MRYRLAIIVDVLRSVSENPGGLKVSEIVRKANVPYTRLSEMLDDLEASGLITKVKGDDNNSAYYIITSKGTKFLKEYERFKRFAENMGIEL